MYIPSQNNIIVFWKMYNFGYGTHWACLATLGTHCRPFYRAFCGYYLFSFLTKNTTDYCNMCQLKGLRQPWCMVRIYVKVSRQLIILLIVSMALILSKFKENPSSSKKFCHCWSFISFKRGQKSVLWTKITPWIWKSNKTIWKKVYIKSLIFP